MKLKLKCINLKVAATLTALGISGLSTQAALVGQWHAADWSGTGSWTNRVSNGFAVPQADPMPCTSAFNGSKGIVFDGDDCFYVPATNNPAVGKTRFTLITLFKTATPGANDNANFWENSALVGGETAGALVNDWAISLLANGSPRAFFGNNVITATNVYVLDNKPHTSALTWSDTADGGDGCMRFYVDGVLQGTTVVNDYGDGVVSNGFAIARGEYNPVEARWYFTGTIGEVRMYDTMEDMAALHDELVNDNPNLIGHWNADDYSGSGNWVDRISSLPAVPAGDPSISASAIGTGGCINGIYFDGNDRFDVTAANNPAVGQNLFTIIASFRTTTGGVNNNVNWWDNTGIVGGETAAAPNDWGLMLLANGSAKFAFSSSTYTGSSVIDNKLHTMALTWSDPDGGGDGLARAYVDGQLKWTSGVINNGIGIVNNGFAIAADMVNGWHYFTGTIGELRIYKSIEDIAALHDSMTDSPCLVGHWVADDWSGSGNWLDRIKSSIAVPAGTPVVATGSIDTTSTQNGLYFDGSSRFDISNVNNPAVGATKFTVIASFQTTTGGINNNVNWWENTGIVGGEAPSDKNDWGLILLQNGSARGGFVRNSLTDGVVTDGTLHTMALTWADPSFGGDAMMRLYVDGLLKATHHGHSADVGDGIVDYGFAIASSEVGKSNFFTGTLGEVRLYSQLKDVLALHAEMTIPQPPPRGTIILIK